jgi:hypothetical protein
MKQGETYLPIDFALTEKTLTWLAEKFSTIDLVETMERFTDNAAAKGWVYRDWQAAFRNYVRNGQKYGGVVYQQGRVQDPLWQPVLAETQRYGFRAPDKNETPAGYRTNFENWKRDQKRRPTVIPLAGVVKRAS